MAHKDKTLLDLNRRAINLMRDEVDVVLPSWFQEDNPKFISLLKNYYEFMDSASNPSSRIHQLYKSRDITQVPLDQLEYIEDELLLGQQYFQGFINKREAAKFSNTLYRSKGSLFTIQQFFRAFFGIDPDVVYTKNNVFKIGPRIDLSLDSTNAAGQQVKEAASLIGPESQRFLTDDKLYQTFALLIRAELPITTWEEVYKLFAHPAGMYLGAEILIQGLADLDFDDMPFVGAEISTSAIYEGIASMAIENIRAEPFHIERIVDPTNVVLRMDPNLTVRQMNTARVEGPTNYAVGVMTLQNLMNNHVTLEDLVTANSVTFDATGDSSNGQIDMSSSFHLHTFDKAEHNFRDILHVPPNDSDNVVFDGTIQGWAGLGEALPEIRDGGVVQQIDSDQQYRTDLLNWSYQTREHP